MFLRKEQPFKPHHFRTKVSFLPKAETKKPRIILSRQAFAQMTLYVEIAQEEVGWMGTVKRLPDDVFLIEKCFLFKQKVHATETEISTEGFSELSMELLEGVDDEDETNWEVNKLRFWGHSHVRMGTSPSMTDDRSMLNDMGKGISSNTGQVRFCFEDCGYPWVIRGIFNKFGEVNFTVYYYAEGLLFEDVEWTVEEPSAFEIAAEKAVNEFHSLLAKMDSVGKESTEPLAARDSDAEVETVDCETGTGIVSVKAEPAQVLRASASKFVEPDFARDIKYRPNITPELRAAVQLEFDKKVVSVGRVTGEKRPWASIFLNRPSGSTLREEASSLDDPFPSEFDDEVRGRGSIANGNGSVPSARVAIGDAGKNDARRPIQLQRALLAEKAEPKSTGIYEGLRSTWSDVCDFLDSIATSARKS